MTKGLDDRQLYISRFSSVCSTCKHLKLDPTAKTPTCKAFPTAIPAVIWNGQNTHRDPFPGDKGIQYEPRS